MLWQVAGLLTPATDGASLNAWRGGFGSSWSSATRSFAPRSGTVLVVCEVELLSPKTGHSRDRGDPTHYRSRCSQAPHALHLTQTERISSREDEGRSRDRRRTRFAPRGRDFRHIR
jgi:hypothetical protein